jgi:Swt1-like HEPN
MLTDFQRFVKAVLDLKNNKAEQAACFMWWAEHRESSSSLSLDEICSFFERARLPQPNRTRLERDIRALKYVVRSKTGRYQLTHGGVEGGNEIFAAFAAENRPQEFVASIGIAQCPYIEEGDVADARKMAALYVSLFCLENSMRRHIERILSRHLGEGWWEIAASSSMKRKEEDRRVNEAQNRWIPSRATAGPLYAIDWPDLVTLMRKYEEVFKASIPDINFLHRFSDLGNLRNVVAHNGIIDDAMQFRRIDLALHDWSKQISSSS